MGPCFAFAYTDVNSMSGKLDAAASNGSMQRHHGQFLTIGKPMQRHRPDWSPPRTGRIPAGMDTPAAVTLLAWDRLLGAGARALRSARGALRRAGLPPLEWYDILVALERRGALRPRDLQRVVGIEQYNLSRLLSRMQAAGLVAAENCPGDGRGQIVALTPVGAAQRAAMWPAYATAIHGAIETRLQPDESIQLAAMLDKVGQPLDQPN